MLDTAKKGLKFYTSGANAVVDARDVAWAMAELAKNPLIQPEYFRFVHPQTLEVVTDWNKQPAVWVLVAAWVTDVRLIDNDYLFT